MKLYYPARFQRMVEIQMRPFNERQKKKETIQVLISTIICIASIWIAYAGITNLINIDVAIYSMVLLLFVLIILFWEI